MRENDELPDHVIERIAELAAEKALSKFTDQLAKELLMKAEEKFYASVGKQILEKFFKIIGLAVVGILIWMAGSGHFKP